MMSFGRIRLWDVAQALWWLMEGKEKNHFDARIADYPTLSIYKADEDGKAVAYLPSHLGAVLESMAYSPEEKDPEKRLAATMGLLELACAEAQKGGVREAYFMSSDEKFDEHAIKHAGFEAVKMLRKRL